MPASLPPDGAMDVLLAVNQVGTFEIGASERPSLFPIGTHDLLVAVSGNSTSPSDSGSESEAAESEEGERVLLSASGKISF